MDVKKFYSEHKKKIEDLMNQKEIKTAELSRRANLNSGPVYNFLNGDCTMTVKNIKKLYDALK